MTRTTPTPTPRDPGDLARHIAAEVERLAGGVEGGRKDRSSFEERAAAECCRLLGVPPRALATLVREQDADRPIRLADLERLDNPPPLLLRTGSLYRLDRWTVGDLYKKFDKSPPMRAFAELTADFPWHRPIGLVFSWPSVARFMCLHSHPRSEPDAPCVRLTGSYEDRKGVLRHVTLEPLPTLLVDIARGVA